MSRVSARRSASELRPLEALQLGVGELQRGERRRHVAGELQLLARDQQHLLDLGQRDLVARRREVAVERLQCRLLGLRFGETFLEQGDLRLRVAQFRGGHGLAAARGDARGLDGGEPLRDLGAQVGAAAAGIEPGRDDGDDDERRDAPERAGRQRPRRRAGSRTRRHRGDALRFGDGDGGGRLGFGHGCQREG